MKNFNGVMFYTDYRTTLNARGVQLFMGLNSATPDASFTASISGTTMTVSAVSSGTIIPKTVNSVGGTLDDLTKLVVPGTVILSQASGTIGSTGTYIVSISQTLGSEALTSTTRAVPFAVALGAEQAVEDCKIEGLGAFQLYAGNLGQGSSEAGVLSFRNLTLDLSLALDYPNVPNATMTGIIKQQINGGGWTVWDQDHPSTTYFNTNTATGSITLDSNGDMFTSNSNAFPGLRATEVTLYMTGAIAAGFNLQLPLASSFISQALAGNQGGYATVGFKYRLRVVNAGGTGSGIWTITTNTNWSLTGTMTIGPGAYREFIINHDTATTMTIQNIGGGTL